MKSLKKIVFLFFIFALLFSTGLHTKKITAAHIMKKTLFKGEKLTFNSPTKTNSIKSAKSSNKKVATVKKHKYKVLITAKKKGTATITIKTKFKITYKYKITVKNKAYTCTAYNPYNIKNEDNNLYEGRVLFGIKNTSGIYASSADISYTMYGVSGQVVGNGTYNLKVLVPGATSHFIGSASSLSEKVKYGKITKVKYNYDNFSTGYTYTLQNKNVEIKENNKENNKVQFNIKNNMNQPVLGECDVIFYSDGDKKNPIDLATFSLATGSQASNVISVLAPEKYSTYSLVKRAYTYKYNG